MTSEKNAQLGQAREAFQLIHQISQLLCTGLDPETLTICIRLCELGVDPEVLAHVIKEIRKMGDNTVQNKPVNLQP
ncbi:mitotic-spindle organizing protein 1-like [Ostrinia furnacalis]|uniref:mitotic-spindle organizing protein 1-like n=1 Tax=Ostrinia furnacalis TaxID=93504 RepID=UPI00103BD10D|nr:mitotic-spindle organizing protein 1-like [Ostrinia furnacalis]XP_028170036.1 mitotic-spindle organizing protein 1-like [Ostrinia furnacalis]